MKTHSASLKNGLMPTTTTILNSQLVASSIPSSNSAFARSIHDFIRVVLAVEAYMSDLPPSPPESQLSSFETRSNEAHVSSVVLARFRSYFSEHNPSDLEVAGRIKCIPVICRKFFVEDMAEASFHHISFAWEHAPDSPYNEWFANMVLKHWTFAKNNGLLSTCHFTHRQYNC